MASCTAGREGGCARGGPVGAAVGLHQDAAGARPVAAEGGAQAAEGGCRRDLLPRHGHRRRGAARGAVRGADEGRRDGHLARRRERSAWLAAREEDESAGSVGRRSGEAQVLPGELPLVAPWEALE